LINSNKEFLGTTSFEKGAECRPAWALMLYKLKVRIDRSGRIMRSHSATHECPPSKLCIEGSDLKNPFHRICKGPTEGPRGSMFKRSEVLYRERIAERIRGNTNDKMKRVMNPLFFPVY
jgi:hypothetical protein